MSGWDYLYEFDALVDDFSQVRLTNFHRNLPHDFYVSVNDEELHCRSRAEMPGAVADLIDLGVAIHIADRFSPRRLDHPRRIHVVLPVRYPEILNNDRVTESLLKTLSWYTCDHWSFEFKPRSAYGRLAERQLRMPLLHDTDQSVEVALWSGGLDSLAGLYNRLHDNLLAHHVLFGTGMNTMIHHTQKTLAAHVHDLFPHRITLIQAPVQLNGTDRLAKVSRLRSRGFFFMLLGSASAYLQGQNELFIYENGIGAINLPFREAEVGLDHSRAVHPKSLLYASELVTHIFDKPFFIQNPFLFYTKAQMCERLAQENAIDLVYQTISCDRRRREKPMQCGCCSSCLMRRQALAVIGIEDTRYTVISRLSQNKPIKLSNGDHLQAMLDQVGSLDNLVSRDLLWYRAELSDIARKIAKQYDTTPKDVEYRLLQLYKRYVQEWNSDVRHVLSRGLLE